MHLFIYVGLLIYNFFFFLINVDLIVSTQVDYKVDQAELLPQK